MPAPPDGAAGHGLAGHEQGKGDSLAADGSGTEFIYQTSGLLGHFRGLVIWNIRSTDMLKNIKRILQRW